MKRYKSLYEASNFISYITLKELQQSFPKLAHEYQSIFEGKKPKIGVSSATEVKLSGSGEGYKVIAVLYSNGQTKTIEGSWGGSNMFVKTAVDDFNKPVLLHEGDAIMQCLIGSHFSCSLYIHPDNVAKLLPSTGSELTGLEKYFIGIVSRLKSAYRTEEFRNGITGDSDYFVQKYAQNVTVEEVTKDVHEIMDKLGGNKNVMDIYMQVAKDLQAKKLVTISSSGAIGLTIEGKSIGARNR